MGYVLVTGGSKGLGRELVFDLARNGYNVIIGYLNSFDEAKDLEKQVVDYFDVKVVVKRIDITCEEEVKSLYSYYDIDILINNACLCNDNYIEDKTFDEFMEVVRVNLGGTFLMCKYAKNVKCIINISSKDGIDTFNPISLDYCSSKAGIINLSKNFSLVYNDKKVYCVCPGWINTDSVLGMNPKYLDTEMIRIRQKELLDKCEVAYKIYSLINSDLVSGSVVIIDE